MRIKYLFFLLFIILIDCGNEPPVINNPIYNILIYQKGSLNNYRDSMFLSVYFDVEDENGYDDIDKIRIIHSDSEYAWELPKDNLLKPTVWNDKAFIGFPFLQYNDGKSVLTGEYIIEIVDTSGNISQYPFYVEIEGHDSNKTFNIPEIKYNISVVSKREIKISGDDYNSCDIKILGDSKYFNGGRKKFMSDKKIILNDEDFPSGTIISVRINKDINESIVYFLSNININ